MRKKGSCRFKTYYKIEVWSEKTMCYQPIQKSYPSFNEASDAASSQKCRIVSVEESGKYTYFYSK